MFQNNRIITVEIRNEIEWSSKDTFDTSYDKKSKYVKLTILSKNKCTKNILKVHNSWQVSTSYRIIDEYCQSSNIDTNRSNT